MALGKQAKILTEAQIKTVLTRLASTRDAERNIVMFLLSVDAGLRAKEIAAITWNMVTDATGGLTDQIKQPLERAHQTWDCVSFKDGGTL